MTQPSTLTLIEQGLSRHNPITCTTPALLKTIELYGCTFGDPDSLHALVELVKQATGLKVFIAFGCNLKDEDAEMLFQSLRELKKLEYVDLCCNQLKDVSAKISGVATFYLQGNKWKKLSRSTPQSPLGWLQILLKFEEKKFSETDFENFLLLFSKTPPVLIERVMKRADQLKLIDQRHKKVRTLFSEYLVRKDPKITNPSILANTLYFLCRTASNLDGPTGTLIKKWQKNLSISQMVQLGFALRHTQEEELTNKLLSWWKVSVRLYRFAISFLH